MVSLKRAMWSVPGTVVEKRTLKTKEGKAFRYVCKVEARGANFELQANIDEGVVSPFDRVQVGADVVAVGRFDFYNGKAQFVCDLCVPEAEYLKSAQSAPIVPAAKQG